MTSPHQVAFLLWAIITAIVCVLGMKSRNRPMGPRLDRAVSIAIVLAYLTVNAWWLYPAHIEPGNSLPIQLCDLAALSAALAFLTGKRIFRALLYFWGIGLSTQGFITPTTEHGPEHGEFWMHWINHGAVVGAAVYDLIVRRYRPTWRDWRTAIIVSLVYLTLIFLLNMIQGWNYAFVGNHKPEQPTLIDHLGAWPLRVLWIALIAAGAMTLLMIPWEIARLRSARTPRKEPPTDG